MFRILMVGATGYDPADYAGALTEQGATVEVVLGQTETVDRVTRCMYDIIFLDLDSMGEDCVIATTESIRFAEAEVGGHTPLVAIGTTHGHNTSNLIKAGVEELFSSPPSFEGVTSMLQGGEGYGSASFVESKEPSQLKTLDLTEFNFEFTKDQVAHLLPIFLRVAGKQILAMETAMVSGDVESVTEIAHKLKGSAAQIGAGQLCPSLVEMEALARAGDITACRQRFSHLRQLFDTTSKAVKIYLVDLL